MRKIRKALSYLLLLALFVNMMPSYVFAQETNDFEQQAETVQYDNIVYVNPLYADVVTPADVEQATEYAIAPFSLEEPVYYETVEEAGADLRQDLKSRVLTMEVGIQAPAYDVALVHEIMDTAMEHTGVPDEGDYIRWQYAGWKAEISYYMQDNVCMILVTYYVMYYTNPEQEEMVNTMVDELLQQLNLDGKSDYEKVSAVYDYVCETVVYDYDNLEDEEYKLKYTAYAALHDKTSVCQGYALLMYRMALELGVDCRLVAGTGGGGPHSWNIVELNGLYYNLDSTWDAGMVNYGYFLKCMDTFTDHERYEEYATADFYAKYPMGAEDYVDMAENNHTGVVEGGLYYDYDPVTKKVVFSGKSTVTERRCNPLPKAIKMEVEEIAFDDCKVLSMEKFFCCDLTEPYYSQWSKLQKVELDGLDTSSVTDMNYMFLGCNNLTSLDLSHVDTTNVTDMSGMFYGCEGLVSLNMSNFDTTNVTDMSYMFCDCYDLIELDLSDFDTTNVTDISYMFCDCYDLIELDLSHFNTANVTDMSYMFVFCRGIANLDLSHFDTTNVTDMRDMLDGCEGLTSLDISNFNTANVTDMSGMFYDCSGLTSLNLSHFDTTNVTDMRDMFYGCEGLTSLNISNFNTVNVTDMCGMFLGCSGLTSLDVSNFDTKNVTVMTEMFDGCSSLTSLGIDNFDTANVTNMWSMFRGCSGITSLELSNFDTKNVTDMGGIFEGCLGLTSLNISNFDTTNVMNMSWMFCGCSGLTSLDISHFDTTNVTDMSYMFLDCHGITNLDLSNFDTTNVIDMGGMFNGCYGITNLDLSNFDTTNVTNMSYMFCGCSGLTSLNISCFDTQNVADMSYMFYICSNLISLNLSSFDISNVNSMEGFFVDNLCLEKIETFKVIPDEIVCTLSGIYFDEAGNETNMITADFAGKTLTRENPIPEEIEVEDISLNKTYLTISEGKTTTLTTTITPGNATYQSVTWKSSDTTVATVDATGKVTALKAGTADITATTSNGKTATCKVTVKAVEEVNPDPDDIPDVSFKDVDEASWQYEGINYVCKKGAMQGVSAISFKPEGDITRGQLVTILHRLDGEPEMEYKDIFPDVTNPTMYYVPGVMWAAKTGVTTGYPDGKFGPEDSIQRQQLATMLYRFAEYKKFDVSKKASFDDFADAGKVESWAEDAMKWAVANKIIGGKPSKNGTIIDPAGTATRAECAKMLMFFMKAYMETEI